MIDCGLVGKGQSRTGHPVGQDENIGRVRPRGHDEMPPAFGRKALAGRRRDTSDKRKGEKSPSPLFPAFQRSHGTNAGTQQGGNRMQHIRDILIVQRLQAKRSLVGGTAATVGLTKWPTGRSPPLGPGSGNLDPNICCQSLPDSAGAVELNAWRAKAANSDTTSTNPSKSSGLRRASTLCSATPWSQSTGT